MMNKIWASFIIVGIFYGILTGKVDIINQEIISSGQSTLDLFLMSAPLMVLWSGIMQIAKDAGLLAKLSKMMRPLFKVLFPDLNEDDEALEYIASNLTINMLGIHNASTPFGLKAMKCLQEKNPKKDTATRSMITFLVLNTSGVTLIATDILAVRMMYGSSNPTELIAPTILATIVNTLLALLMDCFLYHRSVSHGH